MNTTPPPRRIDGPGILLVLGAVVIAVPCALVAQFLLHHAAGGTMGLFGEEALEPTAWWYGPGMLATYALAVGCPAVAWSGYRRWTRWRGLLALPLVAPILVLASATQLG